MDISIESEDFSPLSQVPEVKASFDTEKPENVEAKRPSRREDAKTGAVAPGQFKKMQNDQESCDLIYKRGDFKGTLTPGPVVLSQISAIQELLNAKKRLKEVNQDALLESFWSDIKDKFADVVNRLMSA